MKHTNRYMDRQSVASEIPGLILTAARYGMAELMAEKVRDDKQIGLDLAAFVVADIADGAILRKFDMDTPVRRVADGIVDHLSVARVVYEIAKKHPEARPHIGVLAARALAVGVLNYVHLARTGEVTKGRSKQKATDLATAAFSLVALTGNKKATQIAGVVASGIALTTAVSHLKGLGKQHESGIREL